MSLHLLASQAIILLQNNLSSAPIVQVHGLQPGRRYAFRSVCTLHHSKAVLPKQFQIVSLPAAFATPATVPAAPQPVTLSGQGRTFLIVSYSKRCVVGLLFLHKRNRTR